MELEGQAEVEAVEARHAVRAESGKRQAVAGAPAEAAQTQAGMTGVEARSWAAVVAVGSTAAKEPAGRRARGISRPSAGVTRPMMRAAGGDDGGGRTDRAGAAAGVAGGTGVAWAA